MLLHQEGGSNGKVNPGWCSRSSLPLTRPQLGPCGWCPPCQLPLPFPAWLLLCSNPKEDLPWALCTCIRWAVEQRAPVCRTAFSLRCCREREGEGCLSDAQEGVTDALPSQPLSSQMVTCRSGGYPSFSLGRGPLSPPHSSSWSGSPMDLTFLCVLHTRHWLPFVLLNRFKNICPMSSLSSEKRQRAHTFRR